jgi:putative ABC transport system permease protein
MQTLWQDLRYGARLLLKKPGFTLIAVITLALGIGANTAIFSVVHAVLLQPLPYNDADRLVMLWESHRQRGVRQIYVSPANFVEWREQNSVFTDIAAFADDRSILTGAGAPEEIVSQSATPNLFALLGAEAILGRTFTADDGMPGRPSVAVISFGLWRRRFGGDPGVIGRKLILNRADVTVIGVMPPDFQWFIKQGSTIGRPPELWGPLVFDYDPRESRGRFLRTVARLKPGATLRQAQAEMDTISGRLEPTSEFNRGFSAEVIPLREQFTGDIRLALLALFGAVGFVLLIACANVANLQLARAAARASEVAVRSALGANRFSLARQLLTENILLALLGGAVGLLLAVWGIDALVSLSPPELLSLPGVKINLAVLGFTLGVALLTGTLFGLAPAWSASRANTIELLKAGGGAGRGSRRHRARGVFVAAEVALALVLLVGAGLLARSYVRLRSVDPGFDPRNVLTLRVSLPGMKYPEDRQRVSFFKQAVGELKALPGVHAAGAVSHLPFAGITPGTFFKIEGGPALPVSQWPITSVCVADAGFFSAMQIPLKRGRLFTEQEATEARHVVVINEAMARRHFQNEDPIGKRLTILMSDTPTPTEIIGVVGDAKTTGLDIEAGPMAYWPHPELAYQYMTLVIRAQGDAAGLTAAARNVISALDNEQPAADERTMERLLANSIARARFNTLLLALFAIVATALAAVGVYGVMAFAVAARTQEIGIRMALGARMRDVLRLVIGQGMAWVLIGVGTGLIAALALTRLLKKLLFNVSATDPITFALVALLLTAVALLACWIPARRAAKVDPMVALRVE